MVARYNPSESPSTLSTRVNGPGSLTERPSQQVGTTGEKWPEARVEDLDWGEEKAEVGMTGEQIKNSPEYDPRAPINREYEGPASRDPCVPRTSLPANTTASRYPFTSTTSARQA
jgi:hypothetical protein